jgi:hypothetical protein
MLANLQKIFARQREGTYQETTDLISHVQSAGTLAYKQKYGFRFRKQKRMHGQGRLCDSTAVSVTEDDAQSGCHHVSVYRTTGFIISPYSRLQKTVRNNYNETYYRTNFRYTTYEDYGSRSSIRQVDYMRS